MKNEFKNKLEFYRDIILKGYKDILQVKKPFSLYEPIRYFLYPTGKLLRPTLYLAIIEACGGKPKNFLHQAVALEFFHNFTLMHDDIMDNSELRHNRKTLHKKYDISTAILCGDNLLALSLKKLLINLEVNKIEILKHFSQEIITICEGQSLDKDFEKRKDVKIAEYFDMIDKKTASLIALCCQMGALSVGVERKIVVDYLTFGKNLGIAFQLQDDLLDIIGEESKFGKKTGSDILEGKRTFLLLKAISLAKGKDLGLLKKLVINKEVKEDDVPIIINIYKKLNLVQITQNEIDKYIAKSMNRLNALNKVCDIKFLKDLTLNLLNRTN